MGEEAKESGGVGAVFTVVLDFLKRLPSLVMSAARATPGVLREYAERLQTDVQTRSMTLLWGLCISFLGIISLSGANPFRLFVPGVVFSMPVGDGRVETRIYRLDATSAQVLPNRRPLLLGSEPGDVEANVRRLAVAVARPEGLSAENVARGSDYRPLPDFVLALRKVWFLNDKSQGRLILDLRSSTIQDRLDVFLSKRGETVIDEGPLLDGYFAALTASILETQKHVKSLTYLLDGELQSRKGMKFDLGRVYTSGVKLEELIPSAPAKKDDK